MANCRVRGLPDSACSASNSLLPETNPPMADEHLLTHGPFTRSVVDILRSTLLKLEQMPDFRQDDPAVIELKRHIVRSIAELEIARSVDADSDFGRQHAFAAHEERKAS
jgi:hypothetical protein